MQDFAGCVVNVGDARFAPGAFNIVPVRVTLALESRAHESETLDLLEVALRMACRAQY